MRRRMLAATILLAVATAARADDIVTMPTANQLKAGEVDVAAYYIDLRLPSGAPQFVHYQTLYVGLTDRFEIDIHRTDVNRDKKSVVLVGSAKLLSETPTRPDLVIGVRNFTATRTTLNPSVRDKSDDPSAFLSAAKTFFADPEKPGPPLMRLHLSLGTEDWTLLGESRHGGVFGGVQALIKPWLGAVVQHDGTDLITAITLMPPRTGLTFKGGTFGDHYWAGVAFRKHL